jgi:PAS domain S-box-containing protein
MISVMYVDDEVELLDLGKIFLEGTGNFKVDTIPSAQQALQKLKTTTCDAVVSDYQMPKMDGIQFLTALRKVYPKLPFIIFTGKGREDVVIEAFDKGADFYLQKGGAPKPQFTELARKIEIAVERKRKDETIRQNETFLENLFSSIQDGISILDKNMNIIRINPVIQRWYAHAMPIVGKKCWEVYHGKKERCEFCPSIKSLTTGETAFAHVPMTNTEGKIVGWIDLYTFPLTDSVSGEITGVIEYKRDATRRWKVENALRQSEQQLKQSEALHRSLLEISPDGIVLFDTNAVITFASSLLLKMFGLTYQNEVIGTSIFDWIAPEHHKEIIEKQKKIFDGLTGSSLIYRIIRRDKSSFIVEVNESTIYDLSGKPIGVMANIRDINDQQKGEKNN